MSRVVSCRVVSCRVASVEDSARTISTVLHSCFPPYHSARMDSCTVPVNPINLKYCTPGGGNFLSPVTTKGLDGY